MFFPFHLSFAITTLLLLSGCLFAQADVVRFRYAAVDNCGRTTLQKKTNGATGSLRAWTLGVRRVDYYCQPTPTHLVTYTHPTTNKNLQIPIRFPDGTPRTAFTANTVGYYYPNYTITVEFQPDGTADVIYNSGLFRPFRN